MTAEYSDGILTIKVAIKDEQRETMKRIQVTVDKK